MGDSVNDAALFDQSHFAASIGVRGVLWQLDELGPRKPAYVTLPDASAGFVEAADFLIRSRTSA